MVWLSVCFRPIKWVNRVVLLLGDTVVLALKWGFGGLVLALGYVTGVLAGQSPRHWRRVLRLVSRVVLAFKCVSYPGNKLALTSKTGTFSYVSGAEFLWLSLVVDLDTVVLFPAVKIPVSRFYRKWSFGLLRYMINPLGLHLPLWITHMLKRAGYLPIYDQTRGGEAPLLAKMMACHEAGTRVLFPVFRPSLRPETTALPDSLGNWALSVGAVMDVISISGTQLSTKYLAIWTPWVRHQLAVQLSQLPADPSGSTPYSRELYLQKLKSIIG